MAMTVLWMAMVTASILCGLATGRMPQVGAAAAVQLCLSMAGVMGLWCGVMEVMRRCGLLCGLERILRPLLGWLFPEAARQPETMEKIAANVSANLLGLGNAATPLGIQAVRRMRQGEDDHATDEMCLLIICNTASIQLIPTTVAAVRSGAGCATPFDILPAVWLASVLSVTAGICAAKVLRRVWRRRDVTVFFTMLADGAVDGMKILVRILPALVGLLTAVYMLRASGLLDWLAQALSPVLHLLGIPPETVGLMLIRPISGSGALGVGSELIQRYGPDSLIGRTAAVMLGSTETTFYTIAVYFGAAGIRNTRYAIPAALCADLCGFVAASWAVRLFFGG